MRNALIVLGNLPAAVFCYTSRRGDSTDIVGGIEWVKENAADAAINKSAEKAKKAFAGTEIEGKRLGVIGLGAIGQKVANAAWNATPAKWGGKWENAFIYTYGDGLTNSVPLMTISFNAGGKPVITTLPEVGTGFTPAVIGTSEVDNWTSPVVLERDGDNWTLPAGKSANFFRVRIKEE